ncbi:protein asteroid-like isoform X3 [Maniola jurtina]|uniref:protein asteroid-like isoform X3 n=1 Tax=Maniola jurtina TaxID=191418 RepID=UPI001E687472|nr:protein asteroid-like isoform X3 [Maniola jurtina]
MGVRGLTTYINYNRDLFLKKYHLHDTSLVIDGHSLCAQLYRLLNSFSAFGGDYDKMASCTKTFFKNLRKCNVKPYVIFDGCHESRKLKTVLSRLRSKLKGASRLDPVTQDSLQIFPYLLRDVFREVLIEMKIPYTICEFEADDEIAALARYLQCPVLSYDSDFFIYNVLYIPFNMLETKPKQIEVDGNKVYTMECKLYKVQYVCEHFSGLHEELLPLLAIVLGNDFVEKGLFGKFLNQLKLTEVKRKQNKQQKMIHALFSWLKNETLDSAIIKILGMLRKNQIKDVHKIIKKNVDGYHCNECKSLKYFNISTDVLIKKSEYKMPDVDEIFNSDDKNDEGHDNDSEPFFNEDNTQEDDEQAQDVSNPNLDSLPDWFSDKIRKNLIPTSYLNLYAHHLHIYNPQVENVTKQDSFLSVLPIVRFAFDILTDFRHDHCFYFSRENCNYRKLFVNREYSIERPSNISYEQLTDTDLKQYFQHFLGIKLENLGFDDIKLLPSNFQLFMISVLWWISFCNVPAAHAHSLIMSYIMLEIIDEKIDSSRDHYQFNNKNAQKLKELRRRAVKHLGRDELFLDKNKVLYDDCLIAASVLLKHFEIDRSIRMRPDSYDINKIHSFAQFQCALQQINALNTLCASPFESTVCYKSYNGTFVYNIALKLENQADPLTFIEQYIKGASTVIMFYKSICKIYNELLKKMNLSTVQPAPAWRHSRKRKRNRWSQIY